LVRNAFIWLSEYSVSLTSSMLSWMRFMV
jgi:hypothetical protein